MIQIHGATIRKKAGRDEAPPPSGTAGDDVRGDACGAAGDAARVNRPGDGPARAKSPAGFYIDLLCHDINNMNQVALGYLELALEAVKQGKYDPALLAKPMEMLKDSTNLLENVRKIQRTRSGEQKLEVMDLGRVLEGVVSQYSSVPGREVTIEYEPVEGRAVYASELLRDVFSNLLGNSIKHSTGRVTINVGLADVVEGGESYYRVAVEDDGPGIPDALKARVFDRLVRGTTDTRGKGLGLYLVKALVDSFRGSVWVEDRVPGESGKGSRFVVLLPAAGARPGAVAISAGGTDNNVYMP